MTDAPTLLSLPRFAEIVGIHPLHFMGVEQNPSVAQGQAPYCVKPIFQYSWQHADAVSREEIAYVISDVEQRIANELGYFLGPKWVSEEIVVGEKPYNPVITGLGNYNVRGERQANKFKWGNIISGGREGLAVIQAGAAIVYTDVDGDGYAETATITQATTVTDPSEIAIYYPVGDGVLTAGDPTWQIRPISVSISGGVATIVTRRERLAKANLLTTLNPGGSISGANNSNFLTTVDVYRRHNDPSKQVEFYWRSGCTFCGSSGCTNCTLAVQNGCLAIADHRLGIVTAAPGEYDADDNVFSAGTFTECRQPDYMKVWYRSGFRSTPLTWELAVAHLTLAELDRPICSCHTIEHVTRYWAEDLALLVGTQAKTKSWKLSQDDLSNPFGTTRAALETWRLVKQDRLGYKTTSSVQ